MGRQSEKRRFSAESGGVHAPPAWEVAIAMTREG
jgi:hypothetical protein